MATLAARAGASPGPTVLSVCAVATIPRAPRQAGSPVVAPPTGAAVDTVAAVLSFATILARQVNDEAARGCCSAAEQKGKIGPTIASTDDDFIAPITLSRLMAGR